MKIYVAHKKTIDYQSLYTTLRENDLNVNHEIVLPHEESTKAWNSKEDLKSCDLVIAEVSEQSLSLGIEVGWASAYGCRVIFVHKAGSPISKSWEYVSTEFIEYEDFDEFVSKLKEAL